MNFVRRRPSERQSMDLNWLHGIFPSVQFPNGIRAGKRNRDRRPRPAPLSLMSDVVSRWPLSRYESSSCRAHAIVAIVVTGWLLSPSYSLRPISHPRCFGYAWNLKLIAFPPTRSIVDKETGTRTIIIRPQWVFHEHRGFRIARSMHGIVHLQSSAGRAHSEGSGTRCI
ncbi:hypothetical protein B0H16DRAFT_1546839 [Mycena metata]|uniref:Uncharacterized protein n=1 Tax=Mycena metata TaxID=1033252 RepID=A0AAD7N9G6_9AGAR|nr:hypothetical protein B0H16DRAFT_1546839 [Mycena metata]